MQSDGTADHNTCSGGTDNENTCYDRICKDNFRSDGTNNEDNQWDVTIGKNDVMENFFCGFIDNNVREDTTAVVFGPECMLAGHNDINRLSANDNNCSLNDEYNDRVSVPTVVANDTVGCNESPNAVVHLTYDIDYETRYCR